MAAVPGEMYTDGRDWALVISYLADASKSLSSGQSNQYWCADIPIRSRQSLEDSLDQTALVRDCPDPGLARRIMRVVVGCCFFGLDKHELILPDLKRSTIERFMRERREPSGSEAEEALRQAKKHGLFGWKVGSEIDLPSPHVTHHEGTGATAGRELTAGHIRRGHIALLPCGEGRKERRLVFRAPTVVRPDLPLRSQHGYRVRVT